MNTSRLLRVLTDIESDLGDPVLPAVQNLVSVVTSARDNPAQDVSDQLQRAVEVCKDAASAMLAAGYPPSFQSILEETALAPLVGSKLSTRIDECFAGSAMNPGGALRMLTDLQKELDAARKNASQTSAGLKKLKVEEYQVAAGEFELGLTLPLARDKAQLKSLGKELDEWNKILRVFQEAAGDDEREVQVRSISNSEFLVFLAASPWVADKMLVVVERLLNVYDRILAIRKKWKELAELGVSNHDLAPARKAEKQLLDDAVAELTAEVMKSVTKNVAETRRGEIEAAVTISIKGVAKFLDRGGAIEIASSDVEEPPSELSEAQVAAAETQGDKGAQAARKQLASDQRQFALAQELGRRGAVMATKARIESGVLQLESGDDDPEKAAKKAKA